MPRIEFDIHGHERLVVGLTAHSAKLRQRIKDAVRDSTDAAEKVMVAEVPRDSGWLANSIQTSGITYNPGGLGGGGIYEAELSVGEGVDYLKFVVEGTGRFGPGGGNITSPSGGVMKFRGSRDGEYPLYRSEVSGQPPQDEWILNAQRIANEVMMRHVAEIAF